MLLIVVEKKVGVLVGNALRLGVRLVVGYG